MIDFPAAKNKFSFYLDRKGRRVTIDINSNARIFSKHLDVPTLNETTTIRSLAISFSQNVISLYIDCKDIAKEEIEFNLSKLYLDMEEPNVKLFRERKYPLHLDNNIDSALARASCQKLSKRKPNRKIVKDNEKSKKYYDGKDLNFLKLYTFCSMFSIIVFFPGTEKNRKRDVRDYYSDRNERNDARTGNLARRGDIPIIHGDCDGNMIMFEFLKSNLLYILFMFF